MSTALLGRCARLLVSGRNLATGIGGPSTVRDPAEAGVRGMGATGRRRWRPISDFHRALAVVLGLVAAAGARAASPEPLGVEVTNASEPVLCAEKDNVTVNLVSKDVRRLRIEATHPAYLGSVERDSFAADWTGCGAAGDPAPAPSDRPRRTTLYEDIELWVVGLRFSSFWRPGNAIVRINDRLETGVHLLQVWRIRPMGAEEVAVLYPQDGYWRLRPMAPPHMAPTAFGSSFLVGPVEVEGRPIVKIREVAFDPTSRTFTLAFERGGTARVSLSEIDQKRHTLDIAFDSAIEGRPFAALRSMYVSELNNDVARIAVREPGAKGWREEPIMAFRRATAVEVWAGRTIPSRHNASAPDMVFGGFAAGAAAPKAPPAQ
ncbi:MAG TPA: hypothetical protein VH519_16400 [Hyphomicrobiaceae bacterium]